MNETSTDPGTQPGPTPNPGPMPGDRLRRPHQDLDRLRRSVDDRYIAGVAGGIGRHFGIDPTVIRVLLAVLTFFGGAGLLVYGVCWLFVPEDGRERGTIHVGNEPRKLLILSAAGIGVLLVMGHAFGGLGSFSIGWQVAGLAVLIAVVMIARDRRDTRKAARLAQAQAWAEHRAAAAAGLVPPYAGAPVSRPLGAPLVQEGTRGYEPTTVLPEHPTSDPADYSGVYPATDAAAPPLPPTPPGPPTWQPPRPPVIPPRAKRTGLIWFWPTLALIAIALGVLGTVDAHHVVDPAAYPALALGITGVTLLVGAFVGRPGGLVLIGMASTLALAVATVAGGFNLSGNDNETTPRSVAEVQTSYHGTNGRIHLDLSKVADPENLAGRHLDLRLKAGEIVVVLPPGVSADVKADFAFAGGIDVPGYQGGGIQDSVERHISGKGAGDAAPLELDLHATVGHLQVEVAQP